MRTTLILVGALLVLCSGVALAQTPDAPSPSPAVAPVCTTTSSAVYGLGDAFWRGTVQILPLEGSQGIAVGPRDELPQPTEQGCPACPANSACLYCKTGPECLSCCLTGLPCDSG